MTLIPTLQTPLLTLRPLQAEDAPTLYRINQVEGVLQYFPRTTPPPLERVQRFITNQAAHWEQHGCGNWGILPQENATEIVGWAGLQFLPETGETEVGYLLDRPFWGRGYATQAALAALRDGFNRLPLEQIIGLVHPENLASRRVLEKCGMTFQERKIYFGIELCRYRVDRVDFERMTE